jgi:hypothetical protein
VAIFFQNPTWLWSTFEWKSTTSNSDLFILVNRPIINLLLNLQINMGMLITNVYLAILSYKSWSDPSQSIKSFLLLILTQYLYFDLVWWVGCEVISYVICGMLMLNPSWGAYVALWESHNSSNLNSEINPRPYDVKSSLQNLSFHPNFLNH